MKFSGLLIFILSLSFLYSSSVSAEIIFSDGFENGFSEWTGNDDKWDTTSGGNTDRHEGEARADVRGNTDPGDDVLVKMISTEGLSNLSLDFWYKIKESLEEEDHIYVEWTEDGSSWIILEDLTSLIKTADWTKKSYSIPVPGNNKASFGLRFRAHLGAASSDIFYLDDVVLSSDNSSENELNSTPSPSPIMVTPTPLPSTTSAISATPTVTPVPSRNSTPTPSVSALLLPTTSEITNPAIRNLKKEENDKDDSLINEGRDDVKDASNSNIEGSDSGNNFLRSKSFWIISLIILAVILSLAGYKKSHRE